MILKTLLLLSLFILLQSHTPIVKSFQQIAKHHCELFPIQLLLRIATGNLSQKYGEQYFDYDCYIRQFVRKDGLTIEEEEDSQEDEEEQMIPKENIPEVDLLVIQYAEGLKECLPDNVDAVESVYAIWRFYRYVVQHDYAYEWMRAKIRSGLGYEAERPNAWMDGQTGTARLRLQKLFSNQFYEYLDTLMFKDFLYPIMTFFKKNTVIAMNSQITQSGNPILIQSLESHNYFQTIFMPFILTKDNQQDIFSYTIPGVPLLFAGSTGKFAWSFTGVLVDRTNIEQIQTVGNKFYHHDTEQWIKLQSQELEIPGVEGKTCNFMHSAYGTLYTKNDKKGKVSQYISRWHENEKKNRVLFTDIYDLIRNNGRLDSPKTMEFPFNSILLVNETGIFQYLCPQAYPSYFLYPDMFGEPEPIEERWITTKKKYVAVSNTLLTTMKQHSYVKGETLSPTQEQIAIAIRAHGGKFNLENALQFLKGITTIPHVRKQKQMMLTIYRRVKFIYMPQENYRKQCDQLISLLQKWDNSLDNEDLAPIYILWDYFLRDYTFNYISTSDYGAAIIKHKILSDVYWVGQMGLWSKGTSYGECDSHEYDKIRDEVNGTGHNSSCYLNIMRAINQTREIMFEKYDKLSEISLKDFAHKQVLDISKDYKGSKIEEAFGKHYSRNVLFASEIGNNNVIYHSSYQEVKHEIALNKQKKVEQQKVEKDEELGDL